MKMAKIHVGDVLSGSVVEYRCGRIMIHLENRLLAFVDAYYRPDSDTSTYTTTHKKNLYRHHNTYINYECASYLHFF